MHLPKTNNYIEGWHRGFSELVHENHPSIWKFLNLLLTEQGKNEIIIEQLRASVDIGATKKKYLDLWEKIEIIVSKYDSMDRIEFLRAIALNIKF